MHSNCYSLPHKGIAYSLFGYLLTLMPGIASPHGARLRQYVDGIPEGAWAQNLLRPASTAWASHIGASPAQQPRTLPHSYHTTKAYSAPGHFVFQSMLPLKIVIPAIFLHIKNIPEITHVCGDTLISNQKANISLFQTPLFNIIIKIQFLHQNPTLGFL